MFTGTILPLLALATTTLAGQSIIKNKCSFSVYVTSVDSETHDTIALSANGTWAEPQRYVPFTGISIKIGLTDDALWTGQPILQFAYTAHPYPYIYYDLSTAYGFDPAFEGKTLVLEGSAKNVPKIVWTGGKPETPTTNAYVGDTDLVLTLCA